MIGLQRGERLAVCMAATLCGLGLAAEAGVVGGRVLPDNRDARVNVEVGSILDMQGYVAETHRDLYDVTGHTYKQNPQSYDLSDFQIDGGAEVAGLSFEKAWKYVTWDAKVLGMNPTTEAVARRNYYLNVGEASFNGETYDHFKIPKGTSFEAEFAGALFEMDILATPFTIEFTDEARFTPWLGLGLFGLGGSYDLTAGPAQGTTTYQNPPQVFVIGGHADGSFVAGLPEAVVGGELAFGSPKDTRFTLQGFAGFFNYSGDSGYFSTKDQDYNKRAEIDHFHWRTRAAFEFPMWTGPVLSLGAQYEVVDTEAVLESTANSPEEILARRERYDKVADVKITIASAFIGLAF